MPVRDTDLIGCLPFFLTGIALQWFRNDQRNWQTWNEFKAACRKRFGDPDYQHALRQEIVRRTQGEDERVADFITCIRGLFERLRPRWSEAEQLRSAHRNMLPRLQVAIHLDDLYDFDSFEHIAVRIEKGFAASRTYRAPPPPDKSLCPELAYQGTRSTKPSAPRTAYAVVDSSIEEFYPLSIQDEEDPPPENLAAIQRASRNERRRTPPKENRPQTPRKPREPPANANVGRPKPKDEPTEAAAAVLAPTPTGNKRTPRPVSCWNCFKDGHRFNECSEPRRLFCYRCGFSGVTTPKCPACTGNA